MIEQKILQQAIGLIISPRFHLSIHYFPEELSHEEHQVIAISNGLRRLFRREKALETPMRPSEKPRRRTFLQVTQSKVVSFYVSNLAKSHLRTPYHTINVETAVDTKDLQTSLSLACQ